MSKYNENYYHTREWLQKKTLLLEWHNYQCDRCGSNKNLQIHHKHYRSFGDEMPWDLEVLCKRCHEDEHYINKPDSEVVIGNTNAI